MPTSSATSCRRPAIASSSSPPASSTSETTPSRWAAYGTSVPLRGWSPCASRAYLSAASNRSVSMPVLVIGLRSLVLVAVAVVGGAHLAETRAVEAREPVGCSEHRAPDVEDVIGCRAVRVAVEGAAQTFVVCGGDVDHADDVGVELVRLLHLMGEQLLAHELVERLDEHVAVRDDVRAQRRVIGVPHRAVATGPDGALVG